MPLLLGRGAAVIQLLSGTQQFTAISATMPSRLGKGSDWAAEKCIDGAISGKGSVCHTKNEKAPWLALDFGASITMERVVIHNRHTSGERLRNAEVRVADQLPDPQMFGRGQLLGTFEGPGKDGEVVTLTNSTGLKGRFVIVQIDNSPETGPLNLNEVTVWGKI